MGLLDRARILDDVDYREDIDAPAEFATSIVSSFNYSPDQIDYPAGVFRALQSLIGFTKGSLLLPDKKNREYYPWITKGLDRTTIRRLRIPFDLENLNSGDSPISLGWEPQVFSELLSNREYGLVKKILLIRIMVSEVCTALLLTTDCQWTTMPDPEMTEAIGILIAEFAPGIQKSRLMTDQDDSEDMIDLNEWLESWGTNPATLVTLDITTAIDALIDVIPGLELYRSRRDVINLIRHITGRMGRFHDLKDGRVLILFPPDRLPDHDLYLHQLSRSFASAFCRISSPPNFPAIFRNWPEDKDLITESLSGFF